MAELKARPGDTRFHGRWVGETQGCEMPAHIWDITQHDRFLIIRTRWEDETQTASLFGHLRPEANAFTLMDSEAILVDAQHFVIRGWDTNDKRGGVGPAYDVVFSRPGLAELSAHAVWLRFLEQHPDQTNASSGE